MAAPAYAEDVRVLIVTCTNYEYLPELSSTFEHEGVCLRNLLADPRYGRVRSYHAHVLKDASVVDVELAMERIGEESDENTVLILGFFTHGLRVNRGAFQGSYVALADSRVQSEEELAASSLGAAAIERLLRATPIRRALVLYHCGFREKLLTAVPSRSRHISGALQRRVLHELAGRLAPPETPDQEAAEPELDVLAISATSLTKEDGEPYMFPPDDLDEDLDDEPQPASLFLRALAHGVRGAALRSVDAGLPFVPCDALWAFLEREVPLLGSAVLVGRKKDKRPMETAPMSVRTRPLNPPFPVCLAPRPPDPPRAPRVTGRTRTTLTLSWVTPVQPQGHPALTGARVEVRAKGRASKGWVERRKWQWHLLQIEAGGVALPETVTIRGLVTSMGYEMRVALRTAGGWGAPSEPSAVVRPERSEVLPDPGFEHLFAEREAELGMHGIVEVMGLRQHRAAADVQRRGLERLAGFARDARKATELARLHGLEFVLDALERFDWDVPLQTHGLLLLARSAAHVNLQPELEAKYGERVAARLEGLEGRFDEGVEERLFGVVEMLRRALAGRADRLALGPNAAAARIQALAVRRFGFDARRAARRVARIAAKEEAAAATEREAQKEAAADAMLSLGYEFDTARYEQVADEETGMTFYVDKETGHSMWDPPPPLYPQV